MGFGLLYRFIPGFCIFNELDPVSRFWLLEIICYFISPSVLWSSFGSYSYGVPISDLLTQFYIFHSVKMSPPFYSLCFYVFNNVCPCYQLLQFVITYSPSFLILYWSKYLPLNLPFKTNKLFMSRTDSVQVTYVGHCRLYQCHGDLPYSISVN